MGQYFRTHKDALVWLSAVAALVFGCLAILSNHSGELLLGYVFLALMLAAVVLLFGIIMSRI